MACTDDLCICCPRLHGNPRSFAGSPHGLASASKTTFAAIWPKPTMEYMKIEKDRRLIYPEVIQIIKRFKLCPSLSRCISAINLILLFFSLKIK
ncbi:MAG: hypothetical protein R6U96_05865 [Promethearchaeia archaeon]